MFNTLQQATMYVLFLAIISDVTAQPIAARPDISIKQLGIVGANSVRIERDPASGNLYILQINGIIRRVNFLTDTTVSFTNVYQQSDHTLTNTQGMAFGQDGTLYLVGNDSTASPGTGRIAKGVPVSFGSEVRTWSILARTVAYQFGSVYAHRMNGIAVDPNGNYIYVNSGSATDHGEMHNGVRESGLTTIILKLPTNGQNIILQDDREWLRTNGYLMAEGVRNNFDMAFAANGDLISLENSGDRDDPEEINWIRQSHHYGFPWRIGGNNTPQQYTPYDPTTDPLLNPNAWGGGNLYQTFSNDPTYPPRPVGVTFTEPIASVGPDGDRYRDTATGQVRDASTLDTTISTLTSHRSPNGIVFDMDSLLTSSLKGGAFVISVSTGPTFTPFGDTSQDLLHVDLTKTGETYTANVTRLVSGFNSPLGIAMVGNKLFVMETGLLGTNGSPKLWRVTLPMDPIKVSVKVFLEGPFNATSNFMTNNLNANGILSAHFGGAVIPSAAVDSVELELRDSADAGNATIRKTRSAWLLTDGTIRDFNDTTKTYVEFDAVASGYFVIVRHRNHLGIMTAAPQFLSNAIPASSVDFTIAQSQAYGSEPMKEIAPGMFGMYAGDVSGSNVVTTADAQDVPHWSGHTGYVTYDSNLSGIVTAADVNIVFDNLGRSTHVP